MTSKKRDRIVNPEPFLPLGADAFSSKKRSKPSKHHQTQEKLLPSSVTSKILKEALLQQKEIQHEDNDDDAQPTDSAEKITFRVHGLKDGDDDDVDDFDGFSESQSHIGQWDFEVCDSGCTCYRLSVIQILGHHAFVLFFFMLLFASYTMNFCTSF